MWTISVGSIVRTGETVYFPAFVENGRTIRLGSICYTYNEAQEKVQALNRGK
jgi:hypothetical protein